MLRDLTGIVKLNWSEYFHIDSGYVRKVKEIKKHDDGYGRIIESDYISEGSRKTLLTYCDGELFIVSEPLASTPTSRWRYSLIKINSKSKSNCGFDVITVIPHDTSNSSKNNYPFPENKLVKIILEENLLV